MLTPCPLQPAMFTSNVRTFRNVPKPSATLGGVFLPQHPTDEPMGGAGKTLDGLHHPGAVQVREDMGGIEVGLRLLFTKSMGEGW